MHNRPLKTMDFFSPGDKINFISVTSLAAVVAFISFVAFCDFECNVNILAVGQCPT
jgi:hypothetical protein